MTQRWLGFALVGLFVLVAPSAHAAVTANPTTVDAGSVAVGGMTTSAQATLTSDAGTVDVDFQIGDCTGVGTGTFTFSPASNITLNPSGTFTVTYQPATQGTRTCTVTIHENGVTNPPSLGSFTITGHGLGARISVSPASHDYAGVRVFDMAAAPTKSQVFIVTNVGDDGYDLVLSAITRGGAHPSDFSVTEGDLFPRTITSGNSAQWTVTFNPSTAGLRTSTLSFQMDNPEIPDEMIAIKGTGTTAIIGVSNVDFGTIFAGSALTSSSTLSNTATSNAGVLTASSAAITTSDGNTWFTFGAGLGCTAGETACSSMTGATAPAEIPVRCSPPATESGTRTATLTVTSDADSGTNTATLTCTATRPNIVVDKTTLAFGDQLVNTPATAQTVTVSNDGSRDLTFYFTSVDAVMDSGHAAMFSASTTSGCGVDSLNLCTVAPGTNVVVTVDFTPTSVGVKSAILRITNNDPDSGDSPTDIALGGTGVAPIATPDTATLAFGPVEVGKSHTGLTLTVTNTGTANLTISNAGITAGMSEFSVTTGTTGAQTTVIAPTASASWTLTCTPTSHGDKTGNFQIASNSGGASSTSNIELTCTGQRGVLALNATSYDFMGVREGDTRTANFTLSNTGNVAVTNIMAVLDSKLLGFSITAPATFPISLAAGASTTVTVQFKPANANEGCVVAASGDCAITFSGGWGATPTTTTVTLVVLGDGLNATYDTSPASPNALDFGDVRWDDQKTLQVSVINTGGSPIAIRGAMITPGTALAGEFAVTSCTRNNVIVPCPTMTAPYNSSGVNDTLVLHVTCNPQDRAAMLDAVLTVSSDLNTGTPNRSVPLECNSTTATLELNPATMVLDFGPTDLDAVPVSVTKTITLKNAGTAPLDVGAATRGGTHLARFAFTATNATVVAPGAMFDVDVTYTPLVEKPPNAPDVADITFPLQGALNSPMSLTIQIKGYGADRHIGVGPAPTFPDTFKNPGDAAPVMPVTISNTGYAPLDVSAVMLDNDPIWTLQNPDPVIIPAQGAHDFNVVFKPLMSGKSPVGHLVVMNNDNGAPMVSVDLHGNGLDRNVAMGPRVIPLGFTGIGIPIRLSELAPDAPLIVENADMVNGFRIASIRVDSIVGADGTFEIIDRGGNPPVDVALPPGAFQVFDITFTPHEVGDFEATATLYLDQDPSPQAQVTLRGRGLYVDARGGGGCSTGRGASGGWLALVIAVGALGRRRRGAACAALLVFGVAGSARTSDAQVSRNLNLNVFDPTPATAGGTFHVQPATVGKEGDWIATALLTYANNALVLDTSQNDDAAVKNRAMLMIGGAYVFGGRYEAGARVPIMLQSGDPAGDPLMRFGVEPASGASLGDAALHVKAHLGAIDALGGALDYSAAAALTLPTAADDQFAGNDLPTGRALLLATLTHARLTTTLNAGAVVRQQAKFANIKQGSGAAWGAGVSYRVLDQLWAAGEVFGDLTPGGRTTMSGEQEMLDTIEGLAGVHYRPARTMHLGIALGRGVTSGPGTPAVRGIVTFTYAPGATETKPLHPPRPYQPPTDTDADGVIDSRDECQGEREDADGFEDTDGCPDLDNDKDGVADSADRCPNQAEDRDRFQDDDGCPDPDNDSDGIPDAKDKCPLAAEDKDGFQDGDGCAEADNDGDGIVDSADKCPNEAEVINGNADDDGCPDKGNSLVVLSPDRIELLESIRFSGSRISRSSHNLLGQIGATLRAHPEILRVRLTAHVQPTKRPASDQKLSEARARAVREWLVEWGVDALRLQSSGFGSDKPLVPANARGAREINDRLELIILERK